MDIGRQVKVRRIAEPVPAPAIAVPEKEPVLVPVR